MNIKTDILQYLEDQGIGVQSETLFRASLPDILDDEAFSIGAYESIGLKPDIYIPTDQPRFQIIVKSRDYDTGKNKLAEIFSTLHKRNLSDTLVTGGTFFYYIHADSSGGWIGRNDVDQDEFSINFTTKTRL